MRMMPAYLMSLFFATTMLAVTAEAASAPPLVIYTDVTSGPTTGGENNAGGFVSIFGKNFGSSLANIHVYFGATEVAAYRYFGASNGRADIQQITVQPGSLGGATGALAIKVTVGGISSNTDKTFMVNPGRVLFVDNVAGNDATALANDIAHPWRHVQTPALGGAYGAVLPGDVIVMRGTGVKWTDLGSNNSFLRFISKGGSAPAGVAGSGPITVMAYPGENVQIVNTTNYGISGVDRSNSTYAAFATWITISGLHIEGDGPAGPIALQVYADYWRIVNNELTAPTATTARAGGVNGNGGFISVFGNSIHDIAGGQQENHGVYIDGGSDIPNGSADIAYNHIYNISGGNGVQQYNNGSNGNFYPTNNVLIHHNLIHDVTDKHGINVADGSGSGFQIYNNIIYNTYFSGIRFNTTDLSNARIYNNTFYNTDTAMSPNYAAISNDWTLSSTSVDIRNNIFFPHTNTNYNGGSVGMSSGLGAITNNLWFGGKDAIPAFDSAPKTGNPGFVNAGTDFHVGSSGSPAVDSGSSGVSSLVLNDYDLTNVRPQGAGYDLGAYEFLSNPALAITTSSPLPVGTVGSAYSKSLSASGGAAPYTWSLFSGTLPAGVVLSSAGVLSGTPVSAGTFNFTVKVSDQSSATATKAFAVTVNAKLALTTIRVSPASATVKKGGSQAFNAVGLDQFGNPLTPQPVFQWYCSGGGSVDSTGLFTATQGGTFMVTATTGSVSGSASVHVTQAPTVTQPLTSDSSLAVVNVPETFSVGAADMDGGPVTYLWDLGDGTTATGATVSHTFMTVGTFTVTVTISNTSGDLTVLTLPISIAASPTPPPPPPPPTAPTMLTVLKLAGAVKFKSSGHDACSISGVLPGLPAGLTAAGQVLVLNVGGAAETFTLDANGRARTAHGVFALKLKTKRDPRTHHAIFPGGSGNFSASLKSGAWVGAWGFDPAVSLMNAPVQMIATIQFNGMTFQQSVTVKYTATANVGGTFKK